MKKTVVGRTCTLYLCTYKVVPFANTWRIDYLGYRKMKLLKSYLPKGLDFYLFFAQTNTQYNLNESLRVELCVLVYDVGRYILRRVIFAYMYHAKYDFMFTKLFFLYNVVFFDKKKNHR